jgi:hypothetical protein
MQQMIIAQNKQRWFDPKTLGGHELFSDSFPDLSVLKL